MFTPVLAVFTFTAFLLFLIWLIMLVLNLWIWQKSKATGNLLMMIGAGLLAFVAIDAALGLAILGYESYLWMHLIGAALIVGGFYMSVKPMVAAQLAHLQEKMKHMGKHDSGGAPKA